MRTLPVLHTGAMFRSGLVQIAMDPEVLAGNDPEDGPAPVVERSKHTTHAGKKS